MSRPLLACFLILLVASIIFMGHMRTSYANSEKIRVVAHSEEKAATALAKGCEMAREIKGLKALVCAPEIASSLGLQEDIKIYGSDLVANTQITANLVQAAGNNGEGRKIVVLDTGYNYKHVELASSYLGGKDFVNNDKNPMDDNGHGSHVAGLITADGIDSRAKGVAPAAGIIAGKVLDSYGSGYFTDLIAAIYWAVDGPDGVAGNSDDFKADVINLSMGTGAPYLYKTYCDSEIPELTDAIKYAVDRGVSVVVAAGNYGTSGVSIPGCISYALTVGAVDAHDKIASFSGRGKAVDFTAPGTGLVSAWTGSQYRTADGTSMATPIVSGTIALMKHEHHWYSPTKVRQVLVNTALDLGLAGRDNTYGYGRIDSSEAAK